VKIISLNRDKLLSELRRIAGIIRADHPEVAEVRLFGSLAGRLHRNQRRGRIDPAPSNR
jgi:hypothetical protein